MCPYMKYGEDRDDCIPDSISCDSCGIFHSWLDDDREEDYDDIDYDAFEEFSEDEER